jgi:hypothetical protein
MGRTLGGAAFNKKAPPRPGSPWPALADQSCGSTFTIEAPWLRLTQNLTGLVVSSTSTGRIRCRGRANMRSPGRSLAPGRTTRSVVMPRA